MTSAESDNNTRGIDDPATRQRLQEHAITAFLSIADYWHLSTEDRQVLLGSPAPSTMLRRQRRDVIQATLSAESLTRISLVLAIFEGLQRVFRRTPTEADAWIRRPNADPPFGGRSPLEIMRDGGQPAMRTVRLYIDQWAGGPPLREKHPSSAT
jgi:uncharacterized protein (DUF2384 family)